MRPRSSTFHAGRRHGDSPGDPRSSTLKGDADAPAHQQLSRAATPAAQLRPETGTRGPKTRRPRAAWVFRVRPHPAGRPEDQAPAHRRTQRHCSKRPLGCSARSTTHPGSRASDWRPSVKGRGKAPAHKRPRAHRLLGRAATRVAARATGDQSGSLQRCTHVETARVRVPSPS